MHPVDAEKHAYFALQVMSPCLRVRFAFFCHVQAPSGAVLPRISVATMASHWTAHARAA